MERVIQPMVVQYGEERAEGWESFERLREEERVACVGAVHRWAKAELLRREVKEAVGPYVSERVMRLLARYRIRTVGELVRRSREELAERVGVGRKVVEEIEGALAHWGLRLREGG